jgi:hypothetical protein
MPYQLLFQPDLRWDVAVPGELGPGYGHGNCHLSNHTQVGGFEKRGGALETELQRQLGNASTHRCATNDTEGRRGEVAIGI